MATKNDAKAVAEAVPLSSLCVLDEAHVCWINRSAGETRTLKAGDYVISESDLNRLIEKLKAVRK